MGSKTKIFKTCYLVGKCFVCGVPAASVCAKATRQCMKDIISEDVPSIACKIVLVYCLPATTSIAVIGAFSSPESLRKVKSGAKFAVNLLASPFTAPAYIADTCLAGFETALFGETVPVLGHGPFALN